MKLLLTSGGLMNDFIISALRDLTEEPFDKLNLAFIPTAANMEEGDKWWLIKDLETCKKLEFKSIDIVDISALPKKIWLPRLEEANILLFEGGNTYHLMYWIHKSGLKDELPKLLKTRVYVGISAGTLVATPNLTYATTEKAPLIKIGETIYDQGLSLVNFLIDVHMNNSYFPGRTFDSVETKAKKLNKEVYALDDNSAIKVDGTDFQVISEGKWKKFN